MKRIRTRHLIPDSPARVWAVLTDFRSFAEWNPLNVWADGDARLGASVPMRFVDAGGGKGKVIVQTVTITALVPERRLEWVGRIPLLFAGRHFFELVPSDGGTELLHGEDLSGLIPLTFSAERIARQTAAYEAMNRALEERVALTRKTGMVPRGGIEPPTP
jgi:hypothetical protein